MKIKKLAAEFITVFAVALVTVAIVTFLWNIIGHGEGSRLGNLIPFCCHIWHYLDMGKVTGNQRKIEFPKI
jgi:hypothetical protein